MSSTDPPPLLTHFRKESSQVDRGALRQDLDGDRIADSIPCCHENVRRLQIVVRTTDLVLFDLAGRLALEQLAGSVQQRDAIRSQLSHTVAQSLARTVQACVNRPF